MSPPLATDILSLELSERTEEILSLFIPSVLESPEATALMVTLYLWLPGHTDPRVLHASSLWI